MWIEDVNKGYLNTSLIERFIIVGRGRRVFVCGILALSGKKIKIAGPFGSIFVAQNLLDHLVESLHDFPDMKNSGFEGTD